MSLRVHDQHMLVIEFERDRLTCLCGFLTLSIDLIDDQVLLADKDVVTNDIAEKFPFVNLAL